MASILIDVKKMLGITDDYEHFDSDLIMHINSVLFILSQLGVGPPNGFSITNANDEWEDFYSGENKLEIIKSYVYLKTKLLFDPPLSSSVMEAANRMISEMEWRINVAVDK